MLTLGRRSVVVAALALVVSAHGWAQEIAPGASREAKYTFRNGSAWGMPTTGLVCLGVQDDGARAFTKQASPSEVLTVTAPQGSVVRVVRINRLSKFVFAPDERTLSKSATVPAAGYVQFSFTNSELLNRAAAPWIDSVSFEIRVRFPDGTNARPMRVPTACGFRIVHERRISTMINPRVQASARGVRAPVDMDGTSFVSLRLETNPRLGVHATRANLFVSQDVAFAGTMSWSVTESVLIGGQGTVQSDVPDVMRGVRYGTAGGGFVQRTLGLMASPGGATRTVPIEPTWQLRESGERWMDVNRTSTYYYRPTSTVRAAILSISARGDAVVETKAELKSLVVWFTPRVPF